MAIAIFCILGPFSVFFWTRAWFLQTSRFMVIGLLRVRLHLPMTHSLKEKRSILKRLINRLRTSYNCAVAETDFQDHWQTAELAMVTVYAEKGPTESLLRQLEKEFENHEDFELAGQEIEFL